MALDDLLPGKARPRPAAFRELFGDPAAGGPVGPPPPMETVAADADDWPQPGGEYQAHSRMSNKPELMLTLVQGDGSQILFAYADLRQGQYLQPKSPAGRPVLLLRFYGVCIVELQGRHLDRLLPGIRRHLLAWLAELPPGRDFEAKDATVITGIRFFEEDKKKPFGL